MTSVPGASPQMTTSQTAQACRRVSQELAQKIFHIPLHQQSEQAERYSDIRAKAHDLADSRILESVVQPSTRTRADP